MRVLVTGADGQLGQSIRKLQSQHSISYCNRQQLDISKSSVVAEVLSQHRPEIVINAAAYTAVDRAESDAERAEHINHIGAAILAEQCHRLGIALLHVSTDYVFDGGATQAYSRDANTNPLSVYGASKWRGEEAIRACLSRHVIVRTSWVFSEFGNNFLKTMLRLGRERTELNIVADQHGSPTYAPHLAEVLLRMAELVIHQKSSAWGTWHFCGSPATTWHAFAAEIFSQAKMLGLLPAIPIVMPITTAQYPTPAKRPLFSVLDCAETESIFGVMGRDWRDGIRLSLTALQQ